MPRNYGESALNNLEDKKQQLEKEFYKIYRDFLIICQFFLSAPIGLHKPRTNWHQKNIILNYVHIFWCLSVYSWLTYCIYNESILTFLELPVVQKSLYFSEYLFYLIQLLEYIRLIFFRQDTFWYFQTLILNFDTSLTQMKVSVHYKDLQRFLCHHKLLIFFNLIYTSVVIYFYAFCNVVRFFSFFTVYVLPNVVINVSLLQYYALLFFVNKRGEKLHFHLDRLLNTSNFDDGLKLRHELNLIRSMFSKMDRFTKKVNDHYSISICLVFLGSFVNISVNIFLLYKYFNAWYKSKLIWTVFSLTWILMNIGKMVLILYYNQKVQNMKSEVTLLLSSFQLAYPGTETAFQLFILQLISDTRSNYVCGLLDLDMKFITSLAMAISTLFIFLVQYDITFEALTSTYNSGGAK